MTPEEEAVLRASLTAPVYDAARPGLARIQAFGQRLGAGVPSLALGIARTTPGLGPLVTAGQAASPAVAAAAPEGAVTRAGEAADRLARLPTMGALGAAYNLAVPPPEKTREPTSFVRDETTQLAPTAAPEAPIQAAPSLDPRYAQIGRTAGGAYGGPGPGVGLRAAVDAAHQRQLRAFDDQKALEGDLGVARAGRIEAVSQLEQQHAAKMAADAEEQRAINEAATAKLQGYSARSTQLAEEIGKSRIDSGRFMRNADTGMRLSMLIGAAAGGMLAGLNGGSNQFIDQLNRLIDMDIADQQSEIDNKKTELSARQSIYGQMLQETGDSRLAAMQTRNLLYEAAKTDLKAKADSLGIPEVRAQSELAVNAIEQHQAAFNTQMMDEAYKRYLAQASAAAAAQRAEAQRAWQMQKELVELGLKKDELEIKRAQAGKDRGKEDSAAISETTKRLADDEIVKNKPLIEGMARHVRPDGTIVGFDVGARAKLGAAQGAGLGLLPEQALQRLALSDEERISRQDWNQLALLFQTKVTGSGGSDEQMDKIRAAYEGAGTNAERVNVINMLRDELARREKLANANLDDEQKVELNRRLGREGLIDMPASVKVKK